MHIQEYMLLNIPETLDAPVQHSTEMDISLVDDWTGRPAEYRQGSGSNSLVVCGSEAA